MNAKVSRYIARVLRLIEKVTGLLAKVTSSFPNGLCLFANISRNTVKVLCDIFFTYKYKLNGLSHLDLARRICQIAQITTRHNGYLLGGYIGYLDLGHHIVFQGCDQVIVST